MEAISQESTIKAALPYLGTTFALHATGAIIANSTISSISLKIVGIVLSIFAGMSFLATLTCAIIYWNNPKVFKQEVPKYITFVLTCLKKE